MSTAEKENQAPPEAKKPKLSLSLKKKPKEPPVNISTTSNERFPVLSLEVIEETKKWKIPKNTEKSTNWAMRLFNSWVKQRNERCDDKVPDSILLSDNHEELCRWLCVSVNELWREDGEQYLPEVFLSILLEYNDISQLKRVIRLGLLILLIMSLSHCIKR